MRCWDWFGDDSLVVIDIVLACCALDIKAGSTNQTRLLEALTDRDDPRFPSLSQAAASPDQLTHEIEDLA